MGLADSLWQPKIGLRVGKTPYHQVHMFGGDVYDLWNIGCLHVWFLMQGPLLDVRRDSRGAAGGPLASSYVLAAIKQELDDVSTSTRVGTEAQKHPEFG